MDVLFRVSSGRDGLKKAGTMCVSALFRPVSAVAKTGGFYSEIFDGKSAGRLSMTRPYSSNSIKRTTIVNDTFGLSCCTSDLCILLLKVEYKRERLAGIDRTAINTRTKGTIMHEQREPNAQNKMTLYRTSSSSYMMRHLISL